MHITVKSIFIAGNTVLEAFACGIPVVVPRTQGFSDTVQHEHDGFLFRPGDSADASSYIQRLKDQPALRMYASNLYIILLLCYMLVRAEMLIVSVFYRAMGAAGRKGMADRTISAVVRDLLRWYERGRLNCQSRRGILGGRWMGAVLLSITIPISLLVFIVYDFLVS